MERSIKKNQSRIIFKNTKVCLKNPKLFQLCCKECFGNHRKKTTRKADLQRKPDLAALLSFFSFADQSVSGFSAHIGGFVSGFSVGVRPWRLVERILGPPGFYYPR